MNCFPFLFILSGNVFLNIETYLKLSKRTTIIIQLQEPQ